MEFQNQTELENKKKRFIEEQIDIRIESLKEQLEVAREKLINDLKLKVEEIFRYKSYLKLMF